MQKLLKPSFPHRYNASGAYASKCSICLATVAAVQNEWELARLESGPPCELVNLDRGQSTFSPVPQGPLW